MATMIDRIHQGDYAPCPYLPHVPADYAAIWAQFGAITVARAPVMDPITVVAAGDLQAAIVRAIGSDLDRTMAYLPDYRESWVEFDLGGRLELEGFEGLRAWGFALRRFRREAVTRNPEALPAFAFGPEFDRADLARASCGIAMLLYMESSDRRVLGPWCDLGVAVDAAGMLVGINAAFPPGIPDSMLIRPGELRRLVRPLFGLQMLVEQGFATTYPVVPPARLNESRVLKGKKPILKSNRVLYAVPEPAVKGVTP